MSEPLLKLYVIKSKDGKYFRAKGYGGYGDSWVDNIKKARVYQKPNGARGVVTWFANNWPAYGIPDLIELHVTKEVLLDETDRVLKSKIKKARDKARRKYNHLKYQIETNFKKAEESQAELERLEKELAMFEE